MCLGELVEVAEVQGPGTALVRREGHALVVSLMALDEPVAAGDWLMVHSGFALARLDAQEAQEAVRLRAELG